MSIAIRRALRGKLAGDSTLNGYLATPPTGEVKSLYHQQAPDNADPPYVIFNKMSGTPDYALGSRTYDNEVWQVKGVVSAGFSSGTISHDDLVDSISSRLNALLTDGTISVSSATPLYLRRESDVEYTEQPSGQPRIMHAGALYRLMYQ